MRDINSLSVVGRNTQRSQRNQEDVRQLEDEVERALTATRWNTILLCLIALQAMGVPTEQLFSYLLSLVI